MAAMMADEIADRIVRSLKDNSAELAREQRSKQAAHARRLALMCLIFAAGIAAGALLVTAL